MNFSLFSCILIVHIAGGTIGLVTGLIGMISPKGKKLHRGAGKIFFLAMALIFVSSIYMSVVKQNWFLFFIGFFSFYLAATGYRILALKKLGHEKLKPALVDYVLSFSGMLAGIGLLIISGLLIKKGMFAIVPALFGTLSFAFGYTDIRKFYIIKFTKYNWLAAHSGRMAGAFTATVTAFVVVNIQIQNSWILWISPTLIIIPIGQRQVKKLQSKS